MKNGKPAVKRHCVGYTDKRHYVFSRRKSRVPSRHDISGYDDGDEFQVCSSCDCTGFIPSAIRDDAEADAYEELYPFSNAL